MTPFKASFNSQPIRILLLGAHCDDIEIGCGATLLRLLRVHPRSSVLWVTLSSDERRATETSRAAGQLLRDAATQEVRIEHFRASYFPYAGESLKDYFESIKGFGPDVVFTHFRDDLHQDHRIVNELTWNTFRNHTVLEYEIPKYDGDLGRPNAFVPIDRADMERKCDILLECYESQRSRQWFTRDTFTSLARLRGVECHAPEGYAEAFFARKMMIAF